MLNLKYLFTKKPTIVCIHGFGRRRDDEFLIIKSHLAPNYNFICPKLYDVTNKEDNNWQDWYNRAETAVDQALKQHQEIILLGFSMGGVIASSLANKKGISKLILIAPAFDYLNLNTITSAVTSIFEKKDLTEPTDYLPLPSEFTNTFMELVNNCKASIKDNNVDTLIIHGSDDEVISCASSKKAYHKITHNRKIRCVLEQGKHRLLDETINGKVASNLINDFCQNKLL